MRASAPQWDLPLVLEALVTEPFEPLELSSLKALSWKTALLLALTSAKRVSELTALSVHPSCLLIRGDRSGETLRPKSRRSAFKSRAIQLGDFSLPPHGEAREAKLHLLCPVRVLACYVELTVALRCTEQLFVCFGGRVTGKALSKKRLAWHALRRHCTRQRTGRESLPRGGPCALHTSCGCVNSFIQRCECGGYMHGGVLVNARPLHKVLSLGYVWLFLSVCACWGNTGLVRRGGLWVSGHLTPSPGVNALTFSPGPWRVAG